MERRAGSRPYSILDVEVWSMSGMARRDFLRLGALTAALSATDGGAHGAFAGKDERGMDQQRRLISFVKD